MRSLGTAAGQSTCVFLRHDVVLADGNFGRAALVENEYPVTSAGSFAGVGFAVVNELPPNVPKKHLGSEIEIGKNSSSQGVVY